MLERLSELLGGVPIPGVIALCVLAVVQVAIQVLSLLDLARRQQVLYEKKWLWALIIILGQLMGPIVYLAVGRRAGAAVEATSSAGNAKERSERALDVLYAEKDKR